MPPRPGTRAADFLAPYRLRGREELSRLLALSTQDAARSAASYDQAVEVYEETLADLRKQRVDTQKQIDKLRLDQAATIKEAFQKQADTDRMIETSNKTMANNRGMNAATNITRANLSGAYATQTGDPQTRIDRRLQRAKAGGAALRGVLNKAQGETDIGGLASSFMIALSSPEASEAFAAMPATDRAGLANDLVDQFAGVVQTERFKKGEKLSVGDVKAEFLAELNAAPEGTAKLGFAGLLGQHVKNVEEATGGGASGAAVAGSPGDVGPQDVTSPGQFEAAAIAAQIEELEARKKQLFDSAAGLAAPEREVRDPLAEAKARAEMSFGTPILARTRNQRELNRRLASLTPAELAGLRGLRLGGVTTPSAAAPTAAEPAPPVVEPTEPAAPIDTILGTQPPAQAPAEAAAPPVSASEIDFISQMLGQTAAPETAPVSAGELGAFEQALASPQPGFLEQPGGLSPDQQQQRPMGFAARNTPFAEAQRDLYGAIANAAASGASGLLQPAMTQGAAATLQRALGRGADVATEALLGRPGASPFEPGDTANPLDLIMGLPAVQRIDRTFGHSGEPVSLSPDQQAQRMLGANVRATRQGAMEALPGDLLGLIQPTGEAIRAIPGQVTEAREAFRPEFLQPGEAEVIAGTTDSGLATGFEHAGAVPFDEADYTRRSEGLAQKLSAMLAPPEAAATSIHESLARAVTAAGPTRRPVDEAGRAELDGVRRLANDVVKAGFPLDEISRIAEDNIDDDAKREEFLQAVVEMTKG